MSFSRSLFILAIALPPFVQPADALDSEQLEKRNVALPSVPEAEMPPLPNRPTSLRGVLEHEDLEGNTWVTFPFIENAGSFGFGPDGAVYVAETSRFWQGVPDLRGIDAIVPDDFRSVSVEDRAAMYENHAEIFPEGWFTRVADRIIRLEDEDGNGAADWRTVFSDRFREPLDGLGFSVLAEDDAVYFTCIPHVWKLRDEDGDGFADEEKIISTGYGVRVSFIGHDLHGIIRGPDGRLYFSVGDRGYHVEDGEGETRFGSGRGAVFRCESDGSGLEVYCTGLRNPQELAFDDHGNLFTFDNTGDIGDAARMVYVLEGTDSGWDMAHQSAHQYADILDWGQFRPDRSMWVAERMFDTWTEEQPQWVYPPAAHVANGPSGVTWLTGESLPEDLRDQFLLANYRGDPGRSEVLLIDVEPEGAGFSIASTGALFRGLAISDVDLGYDGCLYLCDWGGGWRVNEKATIQRVRSKRAEHREAGARVSELFAEGFDERPAGTLRDFLTHPDRRVRQEAQFALVEQDRDDILREIAADPDARTIPRLHAVWGLGQLGRDGGEVADDLVSLLADEDVEIRANAARTLGDIHAVSAREALLRRLEDSSPRVRSLAAIALSRCTPRGDEDAVDLLFSAVEENGAGKVDIVLRHALLTALARIATQTQALAYGDSDSSEVRLLALLTLRRHESESVATFLDDPDPRLIREAARAVYDTSVADTETADRLALMDEKATTLPRTIQRRIVAANYRRGEAAHALQLLDLAGTEGLHPSARRAALIALRKWENPVVTDPVHGHYRPVPDSGERSLAALGEWIGDELRDFLAQPHDSDLITLGMELATATGVELDSATLLAQVNNRDLDPDLRVAILDSLATSGDVALGEVIPMLWSDTDPTVRAAAIRQGFDLEVKGVVPEAHKAVAEAPLPVARAAMAGLAETDLDAVAALWTNRESDLRRELWLDAYLHLSAASRPEAAEFAADPNRVHQLSLRGGDPARGEIVFRNQGACLQCHKIGSDGGVQGPELNAVGARLSRPRILDAIVDPGAEITEGYGTTTVTLKSGDTVIGRVASEADEHLVVVGLENQKTRVNRSGIESIAPPVSAMPPMGAVLPPKDLRDLVAFLSSLREEAEQEDGSAHGDESHGEDEEIAK